MAPAEKFLDAQKEHRQCWQRLIRAAHDYVENMVNLPCRLLPRSQWPVEYAESATHLEAELCLHFTDGTVLSVANLELASGGLEWSRIPKLIPDLKRSDAPTLLDALRVCYLSRQSEMMLFGGDSLDTDPDSA